MTPRGHRARGRAQLDRHGQAAALARGARDRDRPVGIVEQRRPGSRPADLSHRAAHVDVDEVGAGVRRDRGRLSHDRGIVAEELHRDRVLVRVDAQELAWVRRSPCTRPKLDTISDTTRPAPWRFAWSRTNQLPMPASGASTTRLASLRPPSVQLSVSERTPRR